MKQIIILKELILRTALIRAGKTFYKESMHVQLHPDFDLGIPAYSQNFQSLDNSLEKLANQLKVNK